MTEPLPERWLTADPGEDTGYTIWAGEDLVTAGTEKMWDFADVVQYAALHTLFHNYGVVDPALLEMMIVPEVDPEPFLGISLVVVENWRLYPAVVRTGALDYDECRTARLIGSIFQACRLAGWRYIQQGADIKERALAAGADALFMTPLHENRHANDAIMHGVYHIASTRGEPWARGKLS